jgi:hypothetical protein
MLSHKFLQKRICESNTFLDMMQGHHRAAVRGIITSEEGFIDFKMTLSSIWIAAGEITPTRSCTAIASKKARVIVLLAFAA